jgi:hypothetical protein
MEVNGYIEMKCGIKIPYITVFEQDGTENLIAPSKILPILQDGRSELVDEEAEEIDGQIFYYADVFDNTQEMLDEIQTNTEVEVTFTDPNDED